MNKIFRVIWSHAQQAWVVVSELVKSHTKTSAYTDKRAQVCTSDYFLDKQQDKFKLSLLSLVLIGIFFSPVGSASYFAGGGKGSSRGYNNDTIAVGYNSRAGGGSIAIGGLSKAESSHAVAMGFDAKAIGENSTAVGVRTQAGSNSVAYGYGAKAQGTGSVAIGSQAKVDGNNGAIAIGFKANAGFQNSVVIGDEAKWVTVENKRTSATENGRGQNSVIVGAHAKAARNSTALGSTAEAKALSATALGSFAKAKGEFSIAIGGGDISNAAIADGHRAIAMGYKSNAGAYAVALGSESKGTGTNSIAIGNSAKTTGADSVVVGANINVTGGQLVAVGYQASAKSHSTALGYKASAGGMHSVAVGEEASTTTDRSTALGNNTVVSVGGGVALGYGSNANTAGGVEGLKQTHSVVTDEKSEANGFKSTEKVSNNAIGAVSVGNNNIKRQIVNVAAGKQDTDAVNVAQLKSLTMQTGGDDSSSGKVGIWSGKLEVKGTSDEIKTKASGSTITIGLDQDVKTKLSEIAKKMSSFKIKTNKDNTEDTIGDGDTIQFTGGENIKITRDNKNLTFGVTSGMFSSTTDGKLSKQTAGLATVEAVVSAVNSAGWYLKIAKGDGQATTPNTPYLIKMGDTATFTAGNNIKLEQNNGNITISTIGKLIKETKIENGDLKITYTDGTHNIIKKGEKGDRGEQGPAGPIGPVGPAGTKGEQGQKGDTGPKGDTGQRGETGPAGPTGPRGPAGAAGPKGEQGPTGPQGPQGTAGAQGQK
ncbi:ESPR-type extended signal peptide-containing protein, partial [Glaesserella parasuis]|uniref:ESPR-type extended signal peptide-containing protein n=1 Tax=Glaesserella parasuis TaxID=738 RepID=UPI002436557F